MRSQVGQPNRQLRDTRQRPAPVRLAKAHRRLGQGGPAPARVPCPQGWCRAALPQEAVRFREPLWRRPLVGVAPLPAGLPDLGPHLQLLGLRPCSQRSGAAVLSVQNLSPLRQGLTLGPAWRLLERLDGLGRPLDPQDQSSVLAPWATGFWRLVPVQSS